MRRCYPFRIGRKDRYSLQDPALFQGWARREKAQPSSREDKRRDAETAAKAESFLRANPFALLFAAQLDLGKPAWKAWRGPYLVATDLGWETMTPAQVLSLGRKQLAGSLRRCGLDCRNLGVNNAAANAQSLASAVQRRFEGHAERVWTTPTNFEQLKLQMYDIPGIGTGIGNMMTKIFVECGMVPQIPKTKAALATLQLKADTHVMQVFLRAGLIKERKEKAAMQAAASLAPDLPAALDAAGFSIGQAYCHKNGPPDCDECPIAFKWDGSRLCPRCPVTH
jgi:endonuclease III